MPRTQHPRRRLYRVSYHMGTPLAWLRTTKRATMEPTHQHGHVKTKSSVNDLQQGRSSVWHAHITYKHKWDRQISPRMFVEPPPQPKKQGVSDELSLNSRQLTLAVDEKGHTAEHSTICMLLASLAEATTRGHLRREWVRK